MRIPVNVRRFEEDDAEDVAEIFAQVGLVHDEEERKRTIERLRKTAREPEWYDHYLVAELDERIIGRVILETAYPPYSELINLYVHQDYRGKGVGSSLVQACIEAASSHKCSIMSTMTDPVGNLPAHRLYSKFGFRPGILGEPCKQRGHMWLFRFCENSFVSEFLKRHPFAETNVSPSKVSFHDRMLYRMSWRDPQTKEELNLYIEGQPSQILEGAMPRISGFSLRESDLAVDGLVLEQSKTIKEGGSAKFNVSFWNFDSKNVKTVLSTSFPDGMMLSPGPQHLSLIEKETGIENTTQFEFTWPSNRKLPAFTTFSTVVATCYLKTGYFENPFFVSAGFEKKSK